MPGQVVTQEPSENRLARMAELVRYGVVGGSAAAMEIGLYVVLTHNFTFWRAHYLIANALALLLANVSGFTAHKFWTFRARQGKAMSQYGKYLVISLTTLFLSELLLFVLIQLLFFGHGGGKVVVTVITAVANYLLNRAWTFQAKKNLIEDPKEMPLTL